MGKGKIPFCDNCGKILKVKGEGKSIGSCECGFRKELEEGFEAGEKFKSGKKGEGVWKKIESKGYSHTCKKCGYGECEVHEILSQWSDESNTYLYMCKRCGYVQRDGYGTSK